MRSCHSSVGVSSLEHQPPSGVGALQTSSHSRTRDAQEQQQPLLRESMSHSQEGRTYGASYPTPDSRRQDSWRSEMLLASLSRTGALERPRWGTQQSDSLSQLHSRETALPGPSEKQGSRGQQVLPSEDKQTSLVADVSMAGAQQASADSFPVRALHR